MNGRRVAALLRRQFDLMRTSPARVLPLFAWVAVDMVLWGYIARYVEAIARATHPLLPALLGMDVLLEVHDLGGIRQALPSTRMGKLLADASACHARYAVIVETAERATLKNLSTRQEHKDVPLSEVGQRIARGV